MEQITPDHPLSKSEDLLAQNIEAMKQLFPEVFSEDKVDFEKLKETLGEYVEDREERFNFTWNGKQQARREAQKPSTGTLRPCPKESVNWEQTQNLYIEGDNLEVLKLLQKSYYGKVKMIYIDPPYNTGKDFVYKDNYRDNLQNYLDLTGQKDEEGRKLGTNSDTSGRYHSNWLNMMYPRLKLARNLLKEDGVIFISIDDNEVDNLRLICDEIFGEENFMANIVWQKKYATTNDAKGFSPMHDHISVYRKSKQFHRNLLPRTAEQNKPYKYDDQDGKGLWRPDNLLVRSFSESGVFPILNPNTKIEHLPPEGSCWRGNKETISRWLKENRIFFGKEGQGAPQLKRYLNEVQNGRVPNTWWPFKEVGHNDAASKELKKLFETKPPFDTPKPTTLINQMVKIGTGGDSISLDFFSGSATTAHAILNLNKEEKTKRKFILVQLPEPTDEKSEAFKAGYSTIAEIGKERIRRVINQVKEEAKENESLQERIDQGDLDLGFKVFKLDSSNIRPWDPDAADLQTTLFDYVDHIKEDRSQEDILYEVLLKYGLDLTLPIEEMELGGKKVFNVGLGALWVCMENNISPATVEGIGQAKEQLQPEVCRVVFKDSGFSSDSAKTNALQTLKRYGISNVRSI